jgi:cobyrinic acid a,c-diamide synthase
MYPDNLEALEAAGAEVVPFDPLAAGALPDNVDGLVVGGGFPEVFAANLGDNTSLLADVRTQVTAGLATWAECGGLLWLCRSLDGVPMAGVIDAHARMTSTLTLGYREATIAAESAVGPPGTRLRGHEFHYSTIDPAGTAMHVTGRGTAQDVGFATPTLLASYVHVHLASDPSLAARFVDRAARRCRDKVGVGTSRPG